MKITKRTMMILENKIRRIITQEMKNNLNENFNSIKDLVDKITSNEQQKIENMKQKLQQFSEWIAEKSQIYEKNYVNITKVLKSNRFEIESLHYITQTGSDRDISKFSLEEEPQLKIEARLKMIGSRKPFTNQGYKPNGSERQQGHFKLAEKVVNELKSNCPGMGFSINEYSLYRSNNIIFEMWVK